MVRHRSYPLTPNQWGIIFHDLVHPGSRLYDVMWTCSVTGALDDGCLERALVAVTRHHEALRTRFDIQDITDGGGGRQIVEEEPELDLAFVDLNAEAVERLGSDELGPAERAELTRLVSDQPFDLTRTPLFRVRVLRAGQQRHRLVLDFHHLVFDGWSVGVFLRDLATAYADCLAGGPGSLLTGEELSWGNWAAVAEEQRTDQVAQRDFWRTQLHGMPDQSTFPSDRSRPHPARFLGNEVELRLPAELRVAVEETARRLRVTPFVLLFSAFALLLGARTGQRDVAVGCPMGARARGDVRSLIGYLINMTVLRLQVDTEAALSDVVTQARGVVLDAMGNQDVPFDQVVADVASLRNLAHNPLFQVLFSFEEGSDGDIAFGPARIGEVAGLPTFAAKFDITFTTRWTAELLEVNIEYDTDLYDAATVQAIAADYALVLRDIVEHPDQPVTALTVGWAEPAGWDSSTPARVVEAAYAPPRTDLEMRLVDMWRDVLDVDEIGIDDNFFQLGGDSLRASRLIGRVSQALAADVPVRALFDHPTVRGIATQLSDMPLDHHHSSSRPRPRAKRSTTSSD